MKGCPVLLLLLLSASLLCGASVDVGPVTCDAGNHAAAVNMARDFIQQHHHHGYKFKLSEVHGIKLEEVDGGCNLMVPLDLLETQCHVVNPKPSEECDIREESETMVLSKCSVDMTVRGADAQVSRYNCDTKRVKTPAELVTICPDCPTLLSLSDATARKAVYEAITSFNQNTSNAHLFVLEGMGRFTSNYIPQVGMIYNSHFAVVETGCPRGVDTAPETCKPLCPHRAEHAYCQAHYYAVNGLDSVECEFYPAKDSTPMDSEPSCESHHPPATTQDQQEASPHCFTPVSETDAALHPICPWPVPHH